MTAARAAFMTIFFVIAFILTAIWLSSSHSEPGQQAMTSAQDSMASASDNKEQNTSKSSASFSDNSENSSINNRQAKAARNVQASAGEFDGYGINSYISSKQY